jgi:hypothetical protein
MKGAFRPSVIILWASTVNYLAVYIDYPSLPQRVRHCGQLI